MIDTSLIDTATTDTLIDWYNDLMDQQLDSPAPISAKSLRITSTLQDLSDELDRRGVDRTLI